MYGVLDGNSLVAINGYTAHKVERNGNVALAYQSCLSGTKKQYLGRGLYSRIMEHAKVDLADRGGAFIFGFPNSKSGPIVVNKLGFSISEVRPLYFFGALGSSIAFDDEALFQNSQRQANVQFDWYEVSDWKRGYREGFFEYEYLTNYIFGRVERRKTRLGEVSLLVIGGIEINKPYAANAFLRNALKRARVNIARVNANVSSSLALASRISKKGNTEPVVCFPLTWSADAADLDVYGGVKDVF